MKRLTAILLMLLLLTGCRSDKTVETVADQYTEPAAAPMLEGVFNMPADVTEEVFAGVEDQTVYICPQYTLIRQTLPGGDLKRTVQTVTGYLPEQLTLLETKQGDQKRYSCVFVCASEQGEQVGRCVILDDGSYHYTLTAMAPAENAGVLSEGQWRSVFASFRLMAPEDVVSSGS